MSDEAAVLPGEEAGDSPAEEVQAVEEAEEAAFPPEEPAEEPGEEGADTQEETNLEPDQADQDAEVEEEKASEPAEAEEKDSTSPADQVEKAAEEQIQEEEAEALTDTPAPAAPAEEANGQARSAEDQKADEFDQFTQAVLTSDQPRAVIGDKLAEVYQPQDVEAILSLINYDRINSPASLKEEIAKAGIEHAKQHRLAQSVFAVMPRANTTAVSNNIFKNLNAEFQFMDGDSSHPGDYDWFGNDRYTLKIDYALQDSVKAGDRFQIKFNDQIKPGKVETPPSMPDLIALEPGGGIVVIATPSYDSTTYTITYTFTDAINNLDKVSGSATQVISPNRYAVTDNGQTMNGQIDIAGLQTITDSRKVYYGIDGDNDSRPAITIARDLEHPDNGQPKYRFNTYVNPKREEYSRLAKYGVQSNKHDVNKPPQVIIDTENLDVSNLNYQIYRAPEGTSLPDSGRPDLNKLIRVTQNFQNQPPVVDPNTGKMTFNFNDKLDIGQTYLIVWEADIIDDNKPTKTDSRLEGYKILERGVNNFPTSISNNPKVHVSTQSTFSNVTRGNEALPSSPEEDPAGPQDERYEMTVEDTSFKTEFRQNPFLAPGVINKVQEGQDGRIKVLYRHVNPETIPDFNPDNFMEMRGQYWEEVSREVIQKSQDEIFEYNFETITDVKNNEDGSVTIVYNTGRRVEIPAPKPKEPLLPSKPIVDVKRGEGIDPATNQTVSGSHVKIQIYNPNTDKFDDEKTFFIPDGQDGTNGKDGKAPNVTTERVEDADPATPGNQPGSKITVTDPDTGDVLSESYVVDGKKGDQGEKGDPGQDGKDGKDGRDGLTPLITMRDGKNEAGESGVYITITPRYYDSDGNIQNGESIVEFIRDGQDGKDGQSVTASTEPGSFQGQDGVWIIIRDRQTGQELDRDFVANGQDGKSADIQTETVVDSNGEELGYKIVITHPDGRQEECFIKHGHDGKDGKDGQDGKDGRSVVATVERGDHNGQSGAWLIIRDRDTLEEIDREFIADGEDGKSPTISTKETDHGLELTIQHPDGKTHTHLIRDGQDGQSITASTEPGQFNGQSGVWIIIRDRQTGEEIDRDFVANGQDGKDGKDGKDGQSPKVDTEVLTDRDGNEIGVRITITQPDGSKQTQVIYHGRDGQDGTDCGGCQQPQFEVKPGQDSQGNEGNWLIIKDQNGNEYVRQFIRDGKDGKDGQDGKTPSVKVEEGRNEKGESGQWIIIYDGDGNEQSREFVRDGRDGHTPSIETQPGKNEAGDSGLWVIVRDDEGQESSRHFIRDGKDGQGIKKIYTDNGKLTIIYDNNKRVDLDIPCCPAVPDTPEKPGENTPNEPGTPDTPGEDTPDEPGTPENPGGNIPNEPGMPDTPGEDTPGEPGTPEKPGKDTPDKPGMPEKPEGDTPNKPGTPDTPGGDAPGEPGTPDKPGKDTPDEPGTPDKPGEDTPDEPGTPEKPEGDTPNKPGTPNKPEDPSKQSSHTVTQGKQNTPANSQKVSNEQLAQVISQLDPEVKEQVAGLLPAAGEGSSNMDVAAALLLLASGYVLQTTTSRRKEEKEA